MSPERTFHVLSNEICLQGNVSSGTYLAFWSGLSHTGFNIRCHKRLTIDIGTTVRRLREMSTENFKQLLPLEVQTTPHQVFLPKGISGTRSLVVNLRAPRTLKPEQKGRS